ERNHMVMNTHRPFPVSPAVQPLEQLIEVSEAAKIAKVSEESILNDVHRGRIRAVGVDGRGMIPRSEVSKRKRHELDMQNIGQIIRVHHNDGDQAYSLALIGCTRPSCYEWHWRYLPRTDGR